MTTAHGVVASGAVQFTERREDTPESGRTLEREWTGLQSDLDAKHATLASQMDEGTTEDLAFLSYTKNKGNAVLIERYQRSGGRGGDAPMGKAGNLGTVEELYSVDVIKPVYEHPAFGPVDANIPGSGIYVLTNEEIAAVREKDGTFSAPPDGWSDDQKRLYNMLVHGQNEMFETAFILRRTMYGARSKRVSAGFTGLNRVGAIQRLSRKMANLIDQLPAGEWLKKATQSEYMGKGQWRVSEEYWWASKWSVIYGGTLDYGTGWAS